MGAKIIDKLFWSE